MAKPEMDYDKYTADVMQPRWQLSPELIHALSRVVISDGLDGQRFSMLVVNPPERIYPDTIIFNGMFKSVNTLAAKYDLALSEAALPVRRLIALDMPGHGYSTKLTGSQHQESKPKGTLHEVTASQ